MAAERAEAAWQRLVDRREQARELHEQRAGLLRDGRVAKALAGHLRANNFERWLLEEALDLLVDGASRILRELTGGQYDLMHDKGEFFVVDHHDAGLRRGVRTLSGGETFQASLALALALSEQLAGMSTTAASLESIVLDEGFGTLDAATLDVVAATLENLAARGDRMVGVVTHVQRAGRAGAGPLRGAQGRRGRRVRSETGRPVTTTRCSSTPGIRPTGPSFEGDGGDGPAVAEQRPGRDRRRGAGRASGRRSTSARACAAPTWCCWSTACGATTRGLWTAEEDGSSYPGLAASYAAGVVRCDLRHGVAELAGARVGRGLFTASPSAGDLVAGSVRYEVHRVSGTGEASKLPAAVQAPLTALEIDVSAAAREHGSDGADLLVVDGPLRNRRQLPRTHRLRQDPAEAVPAGAAHRWWSPALRAGPAHAGLPARHGCGAAGPGTCGCPARPARRGPGSSGSSARPT